jgi:beta-phosphoglucomutase
MFEFKPDFERTQYRAANRAPLNFDAIHVAKPAMLKKIESDNVADIEIPLDYIVFCDMDGTLVNTDYANYLSYRLAVIEATRGKHDVELSGERLNRESLKKRLPSLTTAECEAIASLKATYFTKFISETKLNTGLANIITKCSATNKTILVTCCREKRAIETLRHHKVLECFTQMIFRGALSQSGSSNKYESALSLMGASPEAVLVFENDIADIESAVHAGVPRKNIISVFPGLVKIT